MNRLRRLSALVIALALGFVQASAFAPGDAAQRQRPPAPGPARPLQLPVARESRLDNGVTLVLVEDHRAPLVTLAAGVSQKINWRHTVAEITNQMTLVEATADLLTEGAGES